MTSVVKHLHNYFSHTVAQKDSNTKNIVYVYICVYVYMYSFAFNKLIVSTYNVRTLHQHGKSHQLFTGYADSGIDIVVILEHWLITSSLTNEIWLDDQNWVMVYSSVTEKRLGGIELLMSKHVHRCLQSVKSISNRILMITFHGSRQLTITTIHAPAESTAPSDKDEFYQALTNHLNQVTSV